MSTEMSMNVSVHSAHAKHGMTLLDRVAIGLAVAIMALLIYTYVNGQHAGSDHVPTVAEGVNDHGEVAPHTTTPSGYVLPPVWACMPFALILLCIAVLPLIPHTSHWWESNKNRLVVSLVLAGVTLLFYAFVHPLTYNHETGVVHRGMSSVLHVLQHSILLEYVPFIVLLFSLYVISGGISLRGDLAAHPSTNTAFLAVGALLASFIGTTGASMLLIRPLLQTNSERKHKVHTVIFFIFLVSNCGGLLLPIGDPPLFLGYLRGVNFLWTLSLIPEWLTVSVALLAIYFVWDTIAHRKETVSDQVIDETQVTKLTLSGKVNFLYLVGIVFCVALVDPSKEFLGLGFKPFLFMRELMMLALVWLSLKSTHEAIHKANDFNYHAILEVAALFIGIFICMQVPIEILNHKGAALGLTEPAHFFWTTGALSAFLDNAPTYVVFFETAKVLPAGSNVVHLLDGTINAGLLTAISLGAVFMGSLTYIGNGPNFMVKSIAEQNGVRMPSFFGYMLYSFGILIPLFVIVMFIFIR